VGEVWRTSLVWTSVKYIEFQLYQQILRVTLLRVGVRFLVSCTVSDGFNVNSRFVVYLQAQPKLSTKRHCTALDSGLAVVYPGISRAKRVTNIISRVPLYNVNFHICGHRTDAFAGMPAFYIKDIRKIPRFPTEVIWHLQRKSCVCAYTSDGVWCESNDMPPLRNLQNPFQQDAAERLDTHQKAYSPILSLKTLCLRLLYIL
jgi:hypothetical protein